MRAARLAGVPRPVTLPWPRGRRSVDALTASLIAVAVAAAALTMAAVVTARARIGMLPAKTDSASSWAGLSVSARQFRLFGWVLVTLYYLAAIFCLLQGLNDLRVAHHWEEWQTTFGGILDARADIALYSRFWIATAIALCLIGYWAQRRLRRRA